MRIDGPGRTTGPAAASGGARRTGQTSAFTLPEEAAQARAPTVSTSTGTYDVAALVALQSVDGPKERRRKAVKRGFDLLDVLDEIRIDLLGGNIPADRLERLVVLLGEKSGSEDPKVEALIDEIELRAKVELAKLGRFQD